MKVSTQQKTRTDVMQYYIDPQFAVATLVLPNALTVDLKAGDCINPATGALLTGTDTEVAVVADFTFKGNESVVVFNKHVVLFKQSLTAASQAGVTKAIELLEADPFIEFAN
ncbi:hypothetical protein D3C77_284050 [compost metagenome]